LNLLKKISYKLEISSERKWKKWNLNSSRDPAVHPQVIKSQELKPKIAQRKYRVSAVWKRLLGEDLNDSWTGCEPSS
jgi:hypothetical protein